MNYHPNKWVVVKLTPQNEPVYYRVFATWYGGYLHGDSWQMNSGIVSVKHENGFYKFKGASGSRYDCPEESYGTSAWSSMVLSDLINNAKKIDIVMEVMPEDTNWLEINYEV